MTFDDQGRMIVSDQYGKLYRITVPAIGTEEEIQIEPMNIDIGMAHGLLYAFDSLYAMVNGSNKMTTIDTERACIAWSIPTATANWMRSNC